MTLDLGLWNAIVSTATMLVVAIAATAAFRQLRHLRAQTSMAALLKVLEDWRDPEMRRVLDYVRTELPQKMAQPGFFESLDGMGLKRAEHPELDVCDWYEQLGAYLKYGFFDETSFMDVGASSANQIWGRVEPVILRMRQTRNDALYENFEYLAARGVLFERAHPNGCYPRDTPRMSELGGAHAYGKPIDEAEAASAETLPTAG